MTPSPPPGAALTVEGLSKTYKLVPAPRFGRGARDQAGGDEEDDDLLDDGVDAEDEEERRPEPLATERVREIEALRDVSFTVPAGTAVGVTGPVGSGKTTLLKVIARVTPPTAGRVITVGRVAPLLQVASGLMDSGRTGRQNAYRLARFFGVPSTVVDRRLEEIFDLAELSAKVDVKASRYSGSEFQRLGFAIALNLEADILLVDGKLAVGDAAFQERIQWRLRQARREGLTLVFASSDLDALEKHCDELILLEDGRVADHGAFAEVAARGSAAARTTASLPPQTVATLTPVLAGQSYAQIASATGQPVEAVRDAVHSAVMELAPAPARLSRERSAYMVYHLLGALGAAEQLDAQIVIDEDASARAWVQAAAQALRRITPDSQVLPAPTRPGDGAPDRGAAALLRFITISRGETEAAAILAEGLERTSRRGRGLRWHDVAALSGIEDARAREIIDRMLSDRGRSDVTGKRRVFNEHLAIAGAAFDRGEHPIHADDELTVSVVLETAMPDIEVRCSIALIHAQDRYAVRFEQVEGFVTDRPGRYAINARLPALQLAAGPHVGRVAVRTRAGGGKGVVERDDLLAVEVLPPRVEGEPDGETGPPAPHESREVVDLEWWVER